MCYRASAPVGSYSTAYFALDRDEIPNDRSFDELDWKLTR